LAMFIADNMPGPSDQCLQIRSKSNEIVN